MTRLTALALIAAAACAGFVAGWAGWWVVAGVGWAVGRVWRGAGRRER